MGRELRPVAEESGHRQPLARQGSERRIKTPTSFSSCFSPLAAASRWLNPGRSQRARVP